MYTITKSIKLHLFSDSNPTLSIVIEGKLYSTHLKVPAITNCFTDLSLKLLCTGGVLDLILT